MVNQVTWEQNQKPNMIVTGEEVKRAVFDMHPDKSSGHDGLNPVFFQAYWQIVGRDVTSFCQIFFDTDELPAGINRTLVCLIPKVYQPQSMSDLRPISLCNVLFCIVSKVMANRLKEYLPNLISDKQSAFVERRLLTNNALVAFEVNYYTKRKTRKYQYMEGAMVAVSFKWVFDNHIL